MGQREASRLSVLPGVVLLAIASLSACKSLEESAREDLVGAWSRKELRKDGVDVVHELRLLPNGVYVETTRFGGDPPGAPPTHVSSGLYRREGTHLEWQHLESELFEPGTKTQTDIAAVTSEEIVMGSGSNWTKQAAVPWEYDAVGSTQRTLESARKDLAVAAGCLLGGRLDAGPAWARLRGRAAPPASATAAEPRASWPASCRDALQRTKDALDGIETREGLERCGELRRTLRLLLASKADSVDAFGPIANGEARIDALARTAAKCAIVADPPAP